MEALDQRGATLSLEEPCSRCHARLCDPPPADAGPSGGSLPPFYLFPTGNAFHGACLCAEASTLATAAQKSRIRYLQEALAAVRHALPAAAIAVSKQCAWHNLLDTRVFTQVLRSAATPIILENGSSVDVEGALRLLDEMVGVEDPHSGDCVVRLLQEPFVAAEESQEVASWRL